MKKKVPEVVDDHSQEGADRVHESYLKRLTQQTESTLVLSETVNVILESVKAISSSYKEMVDSIRAVGAICHQLEDSFKIQASAQESIAAQAGDADASAQDEVARAQALRGDLGQLEAIRDFMSQAVESIDEVSSRLNLLSMNARVEAAHAGTHGVGFNVVAQEMLRLQQESQKVIVSQRAKLGAFLPLMAAMQDKSHGVEDQARAQQTTIMGIAKGAQVIRDQTRTNQGQITGLTSAVDRLAGSIEEGELTTQAIDQETSKVEKIFKEEVFVAKKMNDLDRFIFDLSMKAPSLAGALHSIINEYQRISVLANTSYVWQGESWLVTDKSRLPPEVLSRGGTSAWGNRVLVCVGQTTNNPSFPQPLAPSRGIFDVQPLGALTDPRSRLQGLMSFFQKARLSAADLEDPKRISDPLGHATMSVIETLEGPYGQVLMADTARGNLDCAFAFGGAFPNGDVVINHFLSTYHRADKDANKFAMLGECLTLSLQNHARSGRYWVL